MKGLRLYIFIFVLLLSSFVVYAKNTTLKTELFFWEDSNKSLSLYITWVAPGGTYDFDVKIENLTYTWVDVIVWFVDGTITNDSYRNKACLHEWYDQKLGMYITGPNNFSIDAFQSVLKTYTLSIPTWYSYSGQIGACLTHYPSIKNDDWSFSMQARRANFLDIYINPDSLNDTISPYVLSTSPSDWSDNIDISSNIEILFNENMDKLSVESSISMLPDVWWLNYFWEWNKIIINPNSSFSYNTDYNVFLSTWAKDLAWNYIDSTYSFSFKVEEETSWWWGGGWWWGWWGGGLAPINKPTKDNCPDGDNSGDLYDWDCGEYSEVENDDEDYDPNIDHGSRWCDAAWSTYSDELNQAYVFACNMWITTMPTIQTADMMWPLLRKHLAKMISEFSMWILWNSPEMTKVCEFDDMNQESQEMQYYAKTSCQLYLMWLHKDWVTPKDSFDPNEIVTRAQFGTVLSRLLWQLTYAAPETELYYGRHLEALKDNAIMTKIYGEWPSRQELRWRVMLMLMRVNQNDLADEFFSEMDKVVQWWKVALLDEWNLNVVIETFGDNPYYTDKDFVPIKWTLKADTVSKIRVTHSDSNGFGAYRNYYLQKFNSWDDNFVFYAYKLYNSLTINDENKYLFEFFDNDGSLIFTKTVWIDHHYVENR